LQLLLLLLLLAGLLGSLLSPVPQQLQVHREQLLPLKLGKALPQWADCFHAFIGLQLHLRLLLVL